MYSAWALGGGHTDTHPIVSSTTKTNPFTSRAPRFCFIVLCATIYSFCLKLFSLVSLVKRFSHTVNQSSCAARHSLLCISRQQLPCKPQNLLVEQHRVGLGADTLFADLDVHVDAALPLEPAAGEGFVACSLFRLYRSLYAVAETTQAVRNGKVNVRLFERSA